MGIFQAYKMAIKSILGNKVRSLLTMLGVIIGVGAVIAAVAFAQGSTKNITSKIEGMGTNLISINIMGRNSNRNVTYAELQAFADKNSNVISAISPQITGSATIKVGDKTSTTTSLLGTNAAYEAVKSLHVTKGRFLTDRDTENLQKVALVGTAVVKEVFDGTNPIGKDIKINGEIFSVVGVLEERSSSSASSDDDQVIIPITVAQRLMKSAVISSFSVQAASSDTVDSAMEKLTALLTDVYKSTNKFRVFSQTQMLSTLSSVTSTMMLVLGGIATISLIVGGIGIMNIMLVSVTERTREIGIRKAIGAKRKNILIQFLIEALMVTGTGGAIGVLMGLAAIKFGIGVFTSVPEAYSITWILISFGVSLAIGVIFGIFPALKAANLNPIEALRYE